MLKKQAMFFWHNSGTLNQFRRFTIILRTFDTIVYPHTNRSPTLYICIYIYIFISYNPSMRSWGWTWLHSKLYRIRQDNKGEVPSLENCRYWKVLIYYQLIQHYHRRENGDIRDWDNWFVQVSKWVTTWNSLVHRLIIYEISPVMRELTRRCNRRQKINQNYRDCTEIIQEWDLDDKDLDDKDDFSTNK